MERSRLRFIKRHDIYISGTPEWLRGTRDPLNHHIGLRAGRACEPPRIARV